MTYVNDKALKWVEHLAQQVEANLFLPRDVREPAMTRASRSRFRI